MTNNEQSPDGAPFQGTPDSNCPVLDPQSQSQSQSQDEDEEVTRPGKPGKAGPEKKRETLASRAKRFIGRPIEIPINPRETARKAKAPPKGRKKAAKASTPQEAKRRDQVLRAQRTHRHRTQGYIRELEAEVCRFRICQKSCNCHNDRLLYRIKQLEALLHHHSIEIPVSEEPEYPGTPQSLVETPGPAGPLLTPTVPADSNPFIAATRSQQQEVQQHQHQHNHLQQQQQQLQQQLHEHQEQQFQQHFHPHHQHHLHHLHHQHHHQHQHEHQHQACPLPQVSAESTAVVKVDFAPFMNATPFINAAPVPDDYSHFIEEEDNFAQFMPTNLPEACSIHLTGDVPLLNAQQSIDFVLFLEKTCYPHLDWSGPQRQLSEEELCKELRDFKCSPGHAFSTAVNVMNQEQILQEASPEDNAENSIRVVKLNMGAIYRGGLHADYGTEVTPLQIWANLERISQAGVYRVCHEVVQSIQAELANVVRCTGFGATVPTNVVNVLLNTYFPGERYRVTWAITHCHNHAEASQRAMS